VPVEISENRGRKIDVYRIRAEKDYVSAQLKVTIADVLSEHLKIYDNINALFLVVKLYLHNDTWVL
jgi:hypothetical protein